MIFKSKQVNTDPEPYVANGNRYPVERHRAFGVAKFDPRPEFNVTRDQAPWREPGRHGGRYAEKFGNDDIWNPRPEFDHPVNRILVEFRQGRFASLDWFLHEYCHDTDFWVWDGTDAENPTPDEIDHARRVLTRLAAWQRPATRTSSAIETREDT